jgi:DNA-binding NarL/FixJ family response regulator
VDDSPEMLTTLVEMLQSDFIVVGALSSGSAALAQVAALQPDIIVLDIDLGDMSGFLVAERLSESQCRAKIVFVSMHEAVSFVRAAQDLGAGFVGKSRIAGDLVDTLNKVA